MVAGPMPGGTPGDSIETLYVTLAGKADQLIADAEQAVGVVMQRLGGMEKEAQRQRSVWASLGDTMKTAFSVATGIGLYNIAGQITMKIGNLARQLISTNAQMQMFTRSFEVLTGSAEEAAEIIEWVREQAKATPFDVPGLIKASQMLMTWGLDLKEWFTVVGDVAAGMQRPITQVVNAVGTLATGQTGEAIRRFRDLGINLREFTDLLEFDARGALVTPLEEAIPIVKQIMEDRFGGMMESQSKTWEGIMSNMKDTWQQVVQQMGEPLFETFMTQLQNLYHWVEENQDKLIEAGQNIGQVLGAALDVMIAIVENFSAFLNLVDEAIAKLTKEPDWITKGIQTGRGIAAMGAGPWVGAVRTMSGVVSGKDELTDFDSGLALLRKNVLGAMDDFGNYGKAIEVATEAVVELDTAQKAGVQAVRGLGGDYRDMSDKQIQAKIAMGFVASALEDTLTKTEELTGANIAFLQTLRDNTEGLREAADAYLDGVRAQRELEEAAAAAATALELEKQVLLEAADIARGAAFELTRSLQDGLDRLTETAQEVSTQAGQALQDIINKAAEAEAEVVAASQAQITKLRADFAKDQLRRQRQFNIDWARLIREQNDSSADAEADYQYRKQQLLIEGNEIGLADLEARYKMEKDQRARDQGQAQSDFQERYAIEIEEAKAAFDQRIKDLENRLQEEIAKVRAAAEEQQAAQIEKDAETRDAQEEKAAALYASLGKMLFDQTDGNDQAAQLILGIWGKAYDGIETEAIWAAYVAQQQMENLVNSALAALASLAEVRLSLSRNYPTPLQRRRRRTRQFGGYSPSEVEEVVMHPGEWVADAQTTRALEAAVAGPLNQLNVRSLAEQRKRMDVYLYGRGVPAAEIRAIREELIEALKREGSEF